MIILLWQYRDLH